MHDMFTLQTGIIIIGICLALFVAWRIFKKVKSFIISLVIFTLISSGGIITGGLTNSQSLVSKLIERVTSSPKTNDRYIINYEERCIINYEELSPYKKYIIEQYFIDTAGVFITNIHTPEDITPGDESSVFYTFIPEGSSGSINICDLQSESLAEITNVDTTNIPSITTSDQVNDLILDYYVEPIQDNESSTTLGAVKYGAVIKLGSLDDLERSEYAHIRLKDEHEPGYIDPHTNKPREKRNDKINVDPAGWSNFKIDGKWANNRCHLVGYQFSGLNDELRNLATCTSYLNKGTEDSHTNQNNPDGMLYYEQRLDEWLRNNQNATLDYFVRPLYHGSDLTPYAYYLQWVGFDFDDRPIKIQLGGHTEQIKGDTYGVILQNISPSYNIDTTTGIVSKKE